MVGNEEDYTWINKYNLKGEEEEEVEEPQDIMYLVFKGVLEKSVTEVQVTGITTYT